MPGVTNPLSTQASCAVRWRTAQLVGVNAIFFIRVLVLARILAPDAFGLFAIALVPIGILLQGSEFGMTPALVQARAPTQRHYDVAWTIGLVRGLVITGLVVALAPWVAEFAGEPRAAPITQVLALQPLLLAISSIRIAELQRKLEFRLLAFLHLGEAVANTIAAVALAPLIGVWALVAGMLAGNLVRLVISYIVAPYAPRVAFHADAARSLIQFGQWVFVTALIGTLGGALLRLMISRQLGVAELGVYYLATRLTFLLGGTIIDVGSSVAFPIYARLQEEREEAIRVFRAVWSATMALIVPAFALFIALAPSVVADVLGAQWQGTEAVLRILASVCILSIFGDVTSPIWQGMGQPWRNALIEALQSTVLLIGAWLLASRLGVVGAALAWVPAVLVTQLVSSIFLPRVLPRPMRGLAPTALAVVASAFVGAATALVIDRAGGGLPGTIAAAMTGGLVALASLWLADRRFDLGLVRSLQRVFPRLPLPGISGNDAAD
jgi:O-antigen/teichoic acid export membrane protein